MKHVNFPESNVPLAAGKGNENTVAMRVMLCEHPDYKTKPNFYAGKFEFEDEEKAWLRDQIASKLSSLPSNEPLQISQIVDAMISVMPPLWITSMNGWCPLILSIAHPFDMGYKKVLLNNPTDN